MQIGNTVLTTYKVSTDEAQAAVRKLQGVEKERAKQALEDLKQHNKAIDGHIETIGKIGVAVGLAYGAWKTLSAGLDAYLERDDLLTATQGGRGLNAMRQATQGLVSDNDLLAASAKAMNSDFKTTSQQLEIAAKYATAFAEKSGRDTKEVLDAITEALTKGATKGLREFGIQIEGEAGTMGAHNKLIDEMAKRYQALGGDSVKAGTDIERAQNSLKNSIDDLKIAAGQAAIAFTPLVSMVAKLVKGFRELAGIGDGGDFDRSSSTDQEIVNLRIKRRARGLSAAEAEELAMLERGSNKRYLDDLDARVDAALTDTGSYPAELLRLQGAALPAGYELGRDGLRLTEAAKKRRAAAEKARKELPDRLRNFGLNSESGIYDYGTGNLSLEDYRSTLGFNLEDDSYLEGATNTLGGSSGVDKMLAESDALLKAKLAEKEAFQQSIESYQQMAAAAQEASSVLSSAGSAAFGAWIDGSATFGEAFEKAIGQALQAMATQLLATSIQQGVMALVHLASPIPNLAGAAAAGKAAASAAAGALLIGGLAKAMGGGGGGGGGAGGGRAGGGAGGSGGNRSLLGPAISRSEDRTQRPVNVIIPDSLSGVSPYQQAAAVQKSVLATERKLGTATSTVAFK